MFEHLIAFFKRRNSRTIGLIFLMQGALFGSWSAFIPLVKAKFALDDAQLGLLLLSLPLGVLLMNPVAVYVLKRMGPVNTTFWFLILAAVFFIIPILAPSIPLLMLGLFLAGSSFSIVNVSMNTCASLVETWEKVRIMSTCHGLWSTGAMGGSALAGMFISTGYPPIFFNISLGLLVLSATVLTQSSLKEVKVYSLWQKNQGSEAADQVAFAMPNALLWGIIALSMCTNLTEGTLADWAAVYMKEIVKAPDYMMGWGFAAYACFMAAGRFAGDALLDHYGDKPVLRTGGILVSAGFTLAILLPQAWTVLIGFALIGAGVSLGAPILYAAASRVPGMAQGAGLATMNTFAMIGFLGGPAIIGFIAKAFSLPTAFAFVLIVAIFWAWKAGNARGLN